MLAVLVILASATSVKTRFASFTEMHNGYLPRSAGGIITWLLLQPQALTMIES
jgi:hypothetical protein